MSPTFIEGYGAKPMSDDPSLVALFRSLSPVIRGVIAGNSLNAVLHGLTVPQYTDIALHLAASEHGFYLFFRDHPELARLINSYLTLPPGRPVHPAILALRAFFELCTN